MIQKHFGFDCKCLVCLGKVPDQDEIIEKICETLVDNQDVVLMMNNDGKAPEDWKREAVFFGIMSDLAKPLYMGRETEKMKYIFMSFNAAMYSGDSILMKKALDEMKELADKTGLEMMKNEVEMMREVETDQTRIQMMKKDVDVIGNSIRLAVVIFVFYFFGFGYGILFLWLWPLLW